MFGLVEPKIILCDNDVVEEAKKGLEIWGGDPLIYTLQVWFFFCTCFVIKGDTKKF